jgi:AraC-like DNA-binding protein
MNYVLMESKLIPNVCIIAIFQALLMAIFLFTFKKGNKKSNIILGFWFLSYAVIMGCSFAVGVYVWKHFIHYHKLIFVISLLSLLIGPLLYFYTKSLLDENFRFNRNYLIHILPFIVITCYTIVLLIPTKRFAIWRHPLDIASNGIFLLQNLIYFFLILHLLRPYEFSFKTFFFDKKNLKYNWIRFLIIGSFITWIAKLQSFIFGFIPPGGKWCAYMATTYLLALFLFITSIVYLSLKIPDLYLFSKKYMNSRLSREDKMKFKNRLLKYMTEEKLYLDPTLNLKTLAQRLSISEKYLSQIINEMFNQNFYDFVNKYRIKECIEQLRDKNNSEKTFLRIAFECGFNTKSTFNSAFKKHTGVTPKEFRKSHHLK